MAFDPGPRPLKSAISELVSLRGLARRGAQSDLERIWVEVAGVEVGSRTKPVAIRRGVLQVSVADAPLLSQLSSYQKHTLLERLQNEHAGLKIRDLKFRLDSSLGRPKQPRSAE